MMKGLPSNSIFKPLRKSAVEYMHSSLFNLSPQNTPHLKGCNGPYSGSDANFHNNVKLFVLSLYPEAEEKSDQTLAGK